VEERELRGKEEIVRKFICSKGQEEVEQTMAITEEEITRLDKQKKDGDQLTWKERRLLETWEEEGEEDGFVKKARGVRDQLLKQIQKERKKGRRQRQEAWEMKVQKGENYSGWARYLHMKGKKVRKSDPGLRVLQSEAGKWLVGPEVEQEMTGYTKRMWGTKNLLGGEVKIPREPEQTQEEQGVCSGQIFKPGNHIDRTEQGDKEVKGKENTRGIPDSK